ncbi:hypothetical protein DFH07DRAFT_778886 [Mycena maculata]|uniref:Uncharacterized protein n=1 Tax=Mycena maculata TaxID=230809 RepID=A0AAD7MYQ7_9AGAR|nr:hypothetical protein DFH07DRAFT_778886 [Mycena maculata]
MEASSTAVPDTSNVGGIPVLFRQLSSLIKSQSKLNERHTNSAPVSAALASTSSRALGSLEGLIGRTSGSVHGPYRILDKVYDRYMINLHRKKQGPHKEDAGVLNDFDKHGIAPLYHSPAYLDLGIRRCRVSDVTSSTDPVELVPEKRPVDRYKDTPDDLAPPPCPASVSATFTGESGRISEFGRVGVSDGTPPGIAVVMRRNSERPYGRRARLLVDQSRSRVDPGYLMEPHQIALPIV